MTISSLTRRPGCRARFIAAAAGLALAVSAACAAAAGAAPQVRALHDFEASGPVRLAFDQVAAVCATNYGRATSSILLAIVDASPGANSSGILASLQVQVAPYQSACVYLPGASLQAQGLEASVVGLVVNNGVVDQGVIRQGIGIGGGGCIASLQVLEASTRKTVVLAPMTEREQRGR